MPIAKREATDKSIDASVAAARAEETAAIAAVVAATQALAVPRPQRALGGPATSWVAKVVTGQQSKAGALAGIDRARLAALEADLAWRQRRVEAASARIAMVDAEREFERAIAIDDYSPTDDSIDVPGFRGQLARAQARWYLAQGGVTEARSQVVRASEQVAAAKETFARLVRVEAPALPLQLPRWAKASDIRRRGLKVIDLTARLPCRRRTCFRQSSDATIYLTIAEPRARR